MSCHRVVCEECATTWAGVNHCRPCLVLIRASVERPTSVLTWVLFGALAVLLLGVAGRTMVWAGALWARLL